MDALPVDASGSLPQISPDGSLLAVRKSAASGGRSIWVTDLTRNSSSPITFGRYDCCPAWSPSGKRLAFLRVTGKDPGVHIVDVTDASKDELLKGAHYAPFSWSPDEEYLLLHSQTGQIMILFALDGSQKLIPVGSRNGSSSHGRISPNGKFIAFTSNESGRDEIYVQAMPPDTWQGKVSINGGQKPTVERRRERIVFRFAGRRDDGRGYDARPG